MKNAKYLFAMTFTAVLGGVISVFVYHAATQFDDQNITDNYNTLLVADEQQPSAPQEHKQQQTRAFQTGVDFTNAAENTVNGVVHVTTTVEGREYYQINPFHFFFGNPEHQPRRGPDRSGSGSGVIISQDGYIVTNNHVIKEAKEIEVRTNDNRSFKAEVVGKDASTDIALLKIEAENLTAVEFGNSDEVRLGEWVLAVGNPLNLTSTVTAGIISAKGRNINILAPETNEGGAPIESFIQTDAAVNPGNSGGALVSAEGKLIGINTAIKSPTGSFTGYSFAVPSNIVKKVVEDLMDFGIVQRAYLGVSIQNISSELAEENKLKTTSGVYVAEITEDGAAKEAGLKKGDVIIAVNGQKTRTTAELQERIGRKRPGDEVEVTVLRKDKEQNFSLVLRNKMGSTELVERDELLKKQLLGAEFDEVSSNVAQRLRIRGGVQIKDIGKGKIKEAGIKNGFIILRVDKKGVQNFEDLYTMLHNKSGGVLLEGVYPNGIRGYYGVGL